MATNPKPFHEAIVDVVGSVNVHNPGAIHALRALESTVVLSIIPANHDAIESVFSGKFKHFNEGTQALRDHLAAEKARCARKTLNNTQEDDAFGHLSRSRDWGMAEESAQERQAD